MNFEVRGVYRRKAAITHHGRFKTTRTQYWVAFELLRGAYIPPMHISKDLFLELLKGGAPELTYKEE